MSYLNSDGTYITPPARTDTDTEPSGPERLELPDPFGRSVAALTNCAAELQRLAFVDPDTYRVTEEKELDGADFIAAVIDILRAHGLAPTTREGRENV